MPEVSCAVVSVASYSLYLKQTYTANPFPKQCMYSRTSELQTPELQLTSQLNTKLEKKLVQYQKSIPVFIRLRIPSTRIAVAATLWAPFTEENNPNKVYRKGEQLQ